MYVQGFLIDMQELSEIRRKSGYLDRRIEKQENALEILVDKKLKIQTISKFFKKMVDLCHMEIAKSYFGDSLFVFNEKNSAKQSELEPQPRYQSLDLQHPRQNVKNKTKKSNGPVRNEGGVNTKSATKIFFFIFCDINASVSVKNLDISR